MHLERCARRGSAPMRGAIGDRSIFSSLVPYVCDPSSVIDGLAKSMCPELRFSPQLRFTMVKEWPPSLGAAKGGRAKRMTPHRSSVRLAEHSCIYRTSLVVIRPRPDCLATLLAFGSYGISGRSFSICTRSTTKGFEYRSRLKKVRRHDLRIQRQKR